MSDYQGDFIENLKYYRKKKGYSQEKLAELCNVATSTIGCIESRKQYPSFDLLYKMADALDIHPADLFLKNASKSKKVFEDDLANYVIKDFPSFVAEKLNSLE